MPKRRNAEMDVRRKRRWNRERAGRVRRENE